MNLQGINFTKASIVEIYNLNDNTKLAPSDLPSIDKLINIEETIDDESELIGEETENISKENVDHLKENLKYQEDKHPVDTSEKYDKDGFIIFSEMDLRKKLHTNSLRATAWDESGKITAFEFIGYKGHIESGTIEYNDNGILVKMPSDPISWNGRIVIFETGVSFSKDGERELPEELTDVNDIENINDYILKSYSKEEWKQLYG